MKAWSVEFSTVYLDLHGGKFKIARGKFGEVPRIRSVAVLKSLTARCPISYPCYGEREDDSIQLLEQKISRKENQEGSLCGRGVVIP
jgi:hypothetical protein